MFNRTVVTPGEALHGLTSKNATTVFPQSIGLAATWSPQSIQRMGEAISDEARAQYHNDPEGYWDNRGMPGQRGPLMFWSPVVNVARDPRWGRTQEGYGEDPLINGTMATAFVKGLQGDHPVYLKTAAGAKHFIANNEEHNRFSGNADISEKQLREFYFPAYKQVVQEGNASIIMTAYNALNGEPAVTNTWLVRDILRNEWGFKGLVMADYGSVLLLTKGYGQSGMEGHALYSNTRESTAAVMNAETLDMDNTVAFRRELMQAIKKGAVPQKQLDRAFRNVMRIGLKLGMFDPEELSPWKDLPFDTLASFKGLALELAEKSMVLLQNEPVNGKPLLPLEKSSLKRVAVIGPNAERLNYGTYSGTATNPVTPLQGIRDYLGEEVDVMYVPWKGSGDNFSPIAMDNITLLDDHGMGVWKTEFYDNSQGLGEPLTTGKALHIDDAWKEDMPHESLKRPPYAVRYTTTLIPPQEGRYTLRVKHKGSSIVLRVNDVVKMGSHARNYQQTHEVEFYFKANQTYTLELLSGRPRHSKEHELAFDWKLPQEENTFKGDELNLARQADAVIAIMGLSTDYERESVDRSAPGLPVAQTDMLKQVVKANPNTVVVLQSGSSIESPWLKDNIPAILHAWYPGERGGEAIANTLFGDNNPGGKLPITFVKSWDDLPPFNDYDITKGRTYRYFDKTPLWSFGHGLSYTRFDFDRLNLDSKSLTKDQTIQLFVTLTNTGDRQGDEVAQVYVKDVFDRADKPRQRLMAFERVSLPAGESKTVKLSINVADLAYWNEQTKDWSLGDRYEIRVGNSSDNILLSETITIK